MIPTVCLILLAIAQATAVDEATRLKLDGPVTLHFAEPTPLSKVLDAVKGLDIVVDREAIQKAGLDADPKVTIDVDGVPLKAVMAQLVRSLKLTYTVKGSKLTIWPDPYKEPDPLELEARMKREDSTVYAPGYTQAKFDAIKPGQSEGFVLRELGKPMREARSRPQIDWYYGPPTLRVTSDGGLFDSAGDLDPDAGFTVVRAHTDGKVFEVLGGYFAEVPEGLVGSPIEATRKRFGEPIAIHATKATRYLLYSGPKASGSFRTRAIGLDGLGKVVDVLSGCEFE